MDRRALAIAVVFLMVLSSLMLTDTSAQPQGPLSSPQNTASLPAVTSNPHPMSKPIPFTSETSSTQTVTISGTAVSYTENMSFSTYTYLVKSGSYYIAAYYNLTGLSFSVASGATLSISIWGEMGYGQTSSGTDLFRLQYANVTFFIGSNTQVVASHNYSYYATSAGGDEYFELNGSASSSYSGTLTEISIEETTSVDDEWKYSPGTLFSETGMTDEVTSTYYSHSVPITIISNEYNFNGASASSSFSSLMYSNVTSFQIDWSAQYSTTAVYDSNNYTTSPIQGVIGTYSITFDSDIGVETFSSYTVSYYIVQQIPTEYSVTFTESGLPSGATWNVTLNSVEKSSTSTSIVFWEFNGTYSYTVGIYQGYVSSPYSSSVTVSGSNVSVSVTFTVKTYSVTFTESGLPTGATWNVTLNGAKSSSTTSSISFSEANGTYSYTVGIYNGYSASPYSNSVTVNGGNLNIAITFTRVTYTVTFTESGLASGTWYVNITTTSQDFSEPDTTTSISFSEPNGTYSFTVATNYKIDKPSISSGSFTVNGASVSESITFSQVTYTVTFTESGLPTGATWNVTLNGAKSSSTTSSISFSEANGTYSYTVGIYQGYSASPYSSSVTVNGASQTVSITFTQVKYSVTFTETGLPSGTEWYANITGQSALSSTTTTITTSLPNGSYTYSIGTPDKIYSAKGGSFIVDGSSVSVSVSFAPVVYSITFTQSGLPSGTWYINVTTTSQTFSSLYNKSITFTETNGTYSYTVATNNKEYAPSSASGSFTVNGASVSESVTFALYTYSVTFTESGLPASTKWFVNITSGNSYSSTASSITLPAANGTYSYTVATANKIYKPSPSSGSFTVNGSAVSESITFTELTWEVTFTESGLPSGTKWYLNISGQSSLSSTGTSISTYEPNGTYAFTIASSNKIYNPNPSSSTFTMNGSVISETVSFSEIIYTVTVKETGLPSGTWYFNITGGSSYSSATTSLSFSEPNGTYDYTLSTSNNYYAPSPSSGSFTVNGAALTVNVTFKLVAYNVVFKESGLPSGMVWYVVLNGSKTSSNTSSITFLKPNGTYSFMIENPVNGTYGIRYVPKNATGTVTVNGKALQINVTFTTQYYLLIKVTPSNGGTVSPSSGWYSAQSTIKLNATANASFIFSTWSGTGAGSYSGIYNPYTITIGGPVNETAVFDKVYSVTFTETGLPSGMLWYLNISGPRSFHTTSSSITFTEPNGTYSYSYGVNTRYATPDPTGTITVNGTSVTINATFHLVTYTVTFVEIGLPSSDTWSVSLNGSSNTPTNTSYITFTVPNGTYPYSIPPVSNLIIEPESGEVVVNGQNVVVNIVFQTGSSKEGYLVSFIASGLPANTEWFVTLNGYTESSFSDLIQFYVGAGSYSYSISVDGNYHANPDFGNVTVSHNMEVTVVISNSTSSSSVTINVKKVVDDNLPLIIGSSIATVIIGWLLSIYINPENRRRRRENIEKKVNRR